jgi:glycosyltransferase involved in cell wall biosynthesis
MIIITYSETETAKVENRLGESEYSYYFVWKEYRPVLERLGIVVTISDPVNEVDAIYRSAAAHGETCIFLSFTPPHQTQVDLRCPTVPIFAWEFDTIPVDVWDNDDRNDWRTVFVRLGRAITHSAFAVQTVQAEMGTDYPIVSIPAPVWDRFDAVYRRIPPSPICQGVDLDIIGTVVDTAAPDFDATLRSLPEAAGRDAPARVRLTGVVFCSVFNPQDGRKNWHDMLGAFCATFRDNADATLIFKLTHHDRAKAFEHMLNIIDRLSPFKCRIVLVQGYLSDPDYEKLVGATSFTVNASAGEGQCLPLMEFMSAGKPAVAPWNTALTDYLTSDNSFQVATSFEPTCWPHDPRQAYRAKRHRIDFSSLMKAYRVSYELAKTNPGRYGEMSENANHSLRQHCSQDIAEERLRAFLKLPAKVVPTETFLTPLETTEANFP